MDNNIYTTHNCLILFASPFDYRLVAYVLIEEVYGAEGVCASSLSKKAESRRPAGRDNLLDRALLRALPKAHAIEENLLRAIATRTLHEHVVEIC